METNNKKRQSQKFMMKLKRKIRRKEMGLPEKMLGDTMEFGKSTTDRFSKDQNRSKKFDDITLGDLEDIENIELEEDINQSKKLPDEVLELEEPESLTEDYMSSLLNKRI